MLNVEYVPGYWKCSHVDHRHPSARHAKECADKARAVLMQERWGWLDGLSTRARTALRGEGFTSLAEVASAIEANARALRDIPNLGRVTEREILQWLVQKEVISTARAACPSAASHGRAL